MGSQQLSVTTTGPARLAILFNAAVIGQEYLSSGGRETAVCHAALERGRVRQRGALLDRSIILIAAVGALLPMCVPVQAIAQGSGPPRGTEVILWLFIGIAVIFVLGLSTVLFNLGKKVFFEEQDASRLEKVVLFGMTTLASCIALVVIMVVFDLR
jgi:hypothetical protein